MDDKEKSKEQLLLELKKLKAENNQLLEGMKGLRAILRRRSEILNSAVEHLNFNNIEFEYDESDYEEYLEADDMDDEAE